MWNEERILKILQETSKEFDDEFNIPIKINPRLRSVYGKCKYKVRYRKLVPDCIEFSKKHLDNDTDEWIINTIKHEWIHYYLTKCTNKDHGHNDVFRRYCIKLGLPPNRFTSEN